MICIEEELWNRVPSDFRAALGPVIEKHWWFIATVESNVAELTGHMRK